MIQFLILVLVAIGIVISLAYGYKRYKDAQKERIGKYDFLVNFTLTLLAIFVGAFLAFQLSGLLVERTEKATLGAHISRTVNEIEDEIFWTNELYPRLQEADPIMAESIMNYNEVRDIISLNVLLTSPLISKYFSPFGLVVLQGLSRDKEKTRLILNNPNLDIQTRLEFFETYLEQMKDLKDLLVIQREYANGYIPLEVADERMKELHCIIPGKPQLIWK